MFHHFSTATPSVVKAAVAVIVAVALTAALTALTLTLPSSTSLLHHRPIRTHFNDSAITTVPPVSLSIITQTKMKPQNHKNEIAVGRAHEHNAHHFLFTNCAVAVASSSSSLSLHIITNNTRTHLVVPDQSRSSVLTASSLSLFNLFIPARSFSFTPLHTPSAFTFSLLPAAAASAVPGLSSSTPTHVSASVFSSTNGGAVDTEVEKTFSTIPIVRYNDDTADAEVNSDHALHPHLADAAHDHLLASTVNERPRVMATAAAATTATPDFTVTEAVINACDTNGGTSCELRLTFNSTGKDMTAAGVVALGSVSNGFKIYAEEENLAPLAVRHPVVSLGSALKPSTPPTPQSSGIGGAEGGENKANSNDRPPKMTSVKTRPTVSHQAPLLVGLTPRHGVTVSAKVEFDAPYVTISEKRKARGSSVIAGETAEEDTPAATAEELYAELKGHSPIEDRSSSSEDRSSHSDHANAASVTSDSQLPDPQTAQGAAEEKSRAKEQGAQLPDQQPPADQQPQHRAVNSEADTFVTWPLRTHANVVERVNTVNLATDPAACDQLALKCCPINATSMRTFFLRPSSVSYRCTTNGIGEFGAPERPANARGSTAVRAFLHGRATATIGQGGHGRQSWVDAYMSIDGDALPSVSSGGSGDDPGPVFRKATPLESATFVDFVVHAKTRNPRAAGAKMKALHDSLAQFSQHNLCLIDQSYVDPLEPPRPPFFIPQQHFGPNANQIGIEAGSYVAAKSCNDGHTEPSGLYTSLTPPGDQELQVRTFAEHSQATNRSSDAQCVAKIQSALWRGSSLNSVPLECQSLGDLAVSVRVKTQIPTAGLLRMHTTPRIADAWVKLERFGSVTGDDLPTSPEYVDRLSSSNTGGRGGGGGGGEGLPSTSSSKVPGTSNEEYPWPWRRSDAARVYLVVVVDVASTTPWDEEAPFVRWGSSCTASTFPSSSSGSNPPTSTSSNLNNRTLEDRFAPKPWPAQVHHCESIVHDGAAQEDVSSSKLEALGHIRRHRWAVPLKATALQAAFDAAVSTSTSSSSASSSGSSASNSNSNSKTSQKFTDGLDLAVDFTIEGKVDFRLWEPAAGHDAKATVPWRVRLKTAAALSAATLVSSPFALSRTNANSAREVSIRSSPSSVDGVTSSVSSSSNPNGMGQYQYRPRSTEFPLRLTPHRFNAVSLTAMCSTRDSVVVSAAASQSSPLSSGDHSSNEKKTVHCTAFSDAECRTTYGANAVFSPAHQLCTMSGLAPKLPRPEVPTDPSTPGPDSGSGDGGGSTPNAPPLVLPAFMQPLSHGSISETAGKNSSASNTTTTGDGQNKATGNTRSDSDIVDEDTVNNGLLLMSFSLIILILALLLLIVGITLLRCCSPRKYVRAERWVWRQKVKIDFWRAGRALQQKRRDDHLRREREQRQANAFTVPSDFGHRRSSESVSAPGQTFEHSHHNHQGSHGGHSNTNNLSSNNDPFALSRSADNNDRGGKFDPAQKTVSRLSNVKANGSSRRGGTKNRRDERSMIPSQQNGGGSGKGTDGRNGPMRGSGFQSLNSVGGHDDVQIASVLNPIASAHTASWVGARGGSTRHSSDIVTGLDGLQQQPPHSRGQAATMNAHMADPARDQQRAHRRAGQPVEDGSAYASEIIRTHHPRHRSNADVTRSPPHNHRTQNNNAPQLLENQAAPFGGESQSPPQQQDQSTSSLRRRRRPNHQSSHEGQKQEGSSSAGQRIG